MRASAKTTDSPSGIPVLLRPKEESASSFGEPYAHYSEVLVFPTSEDSIGALVLMAHAEEQKAAQQALLDEVQVNIQAEESA